MRERESDLHIFDLDRTLFRKNGSFAFYHFLLKKGILPWSTLIRCIPLLFRSLDLTFLHREVFRRVLKGVPLSHLEEVVEPFLDQSMDRLLSPFVYRCLQKAKKRGAVVALLSSSPHFLVSRIAKRLRIQRWAGTEYAVDKEGKLCDIATLITGRTKLCIAKQWAAECGLSSHQSAAYSDSNDDLPLLEWVGHPIAVQPDRQLLAVARERRWLVFS
ncbi:MAG: HAD-IB family hydrolase [Verrucomicrobiota bacterium]|nr:HAD-IB family hydrolase [Verrucomicrobiota bacterium]